MAQSPKAWEHPTYPGCRWCGRTDVGHYRGGLCRTDSRDDAIVTAAKVGDVALDALKIERDYTPPAPAPVSDTPREATLPGERRPGLHPSPEPPDIDSPGRPTIGERLGGLFGVKKSEEPREPLPPTREVRPGKRLARTSVAELLGQGWALLGGLADRTPSGLRTDLGQTPAGNCLRFQAPMAGEILDDTLKGTVIDRRVLQPLSRSVGKIDVVVSLAAPPAIVWAIQSDPKKADALMPLLYAAIQRSLPQYVEATKKAKKKVEQRAQAAADLFVEGLPEGADPIAFIIEQMFGGMITVEATAEPVGVP